MNPTPAHQLPTIRESSTLGLRFGVGTWCAIFGSLGTGMVVLVGFCIWLSTMHTDVQGLKSSQSKTTETLERIEATVREIEFRQKYGITAGLPVPMKANP